MSTLNDGVNEFKIRSIDLLGNIGETMVSRVLVDTVAPEIGSLAFFFTRTSEENAEFVLRVSVNLIQDQTSGLNPFGEIKTKPTGSEDWQSTDIDLTPFLTGDKIEEGNGGNPKAENTSFDIIVPSPLAEMYDIQMKIKDVAGNESVSEVLSLEVDTNVVIQRA